MSNMVIQTNVLALNSHRNLKVIGGKQFQASSRLSSGYRINSAADDAAGLAISEKMRAQIRGLDMASKNTQDGISLVQTAEGGLQEIDNMVQRIRELVVQASNDSNDFATADRKKLQDEIEQLTQGIDNMASQVEFNAKKLLDGSLLDSTTRAQLLGDVNVRLTNLIGDGESSITSTRSTQNAAAQIETDGLKGANAISTMGKVFSAALGHDAAVSTAFTALASGSPAQVTSAPFNKTDFEDLAALEKFIEDAGKDIATLMAGRASAASSATPSPTTVATFSEGINALNGQIDAARQLYAGAKLAVAQANSYDTIDKIEGNGLWFQTGSNSMQGISVGIGSIKSDVLGIGFGNGVSSINVNSATAIEISSFIDIVDTGLQYVTAQRAMLGAVQNRMEYTKSSLDISSENLSAAESRIRDADMGKEMMRMTAANILQQAGVSMLAQANQSPQNVLQLLR